MGPPGTGKTLLAKAPTRSLLCFFPFIDVHNCQLRTEAVAGEADCPFYSMNLGNVLVMIVLDCIDDSFQPTEEWL